MGHVDDRFGTNLVQGIRGAVVSTVYTLNLVIKECTAISSQSGHHHSRVDGFRRGTTASTGQH